METPSDIVLETVSHDGRHRYVCTNSDITCHISASKRRTGTFRAKLATLSDDCTEAVSGSYYSRLTMFIMLAPLPLLFAAPILLADPRIPTGYLFAAFALWFIGVAAIGVRRDVRFSLHYQDTHTAFEVVGRASYRERIREFVGRVLLRAKALRDDFTAA